MRGRCPPHVSSLQLQVGRCQSQRDRSRRVGRSCAHARRRPRMSSLQLQVGRRQSQRDRHRSCSQPRRSLVLTFECPPHMSDVLPMQMQVRSIYCHRRRCNSAYRRAAAVSRTHRRVGRRWLPCTRDLRTYCNNADAASPLHSLPPMQMQLRWLPCTRDLRTYCHNADAASPLHSLPPTQMQLR